jgi:hypothetical protein
MNLEAMGNVGEMLGGLAVVVSLIYLAMQLRQNTNQVRSATYQSIVAAAAACNVTITQSKELARILRLGSLDTAQLDEDERVQFSFLCSQFFDIFENLFLQHLHGVIDDDFWEPRARAYLALFETEGFAQAWRERHVDYSRSFQSYVSERLAVPGDSDISTRLFLSGD